MAAPFYWPLVRRSVRLTCAYYAWQDRKALRRLRKGDIGGRSGRRHGRLSVDASLAYIERAYREYLEFAGVERLTGVIGEVGPGDNMGVAALLLANGATHVHAVDRFRPERDPAHQARIYEALARRHGLDGVFDGPPAEDTLRGLTYHAGAPAERFFHETELRFDAIVSRAVMEHLVDPILALDGMLKALRPDGLLIHRIDLRDHGMFEGHHPLTFLGVPTARYRNLIRASGRPNRVMLATYRAWLERTGMEGRILVARLVGHPDEIIPALPWDEVAPGLRARALAETAAFRPRLDSEFRTHADADLAVTGFALVLRKRPRR